MRVSIVANWQDMIVLSPFLLFVGGVMTDEHGGSQWKELSLTSRGVARPAKKPASC